ncbi:MAG: HAD family hydrolase [Rickettsiales bacterium]|nr:HAD family hydrolase [Pseudomonadota bacterium]MDA0967011.1 HAD family hydrolase [Pseudomonadota bacterium]MDG4543931.1 HAD family hydrolase [Rickettsiales bacterium]MDG4546077.1 HAD family hydrolase [Rickettsiales bacterium]MDG4548323.1 HAD family hydrolase [Rickettsiales bacterium]
MNKKQVSVVITDLDNTLYNWFDIWYYPFNAMLNKIEKISGISKENLLPEIKEIHQKYGTAEYAFLIQEIPSLKRLHPNEELVKVYDEAIHAFNSERKKHLKLYDGVKETLEFFKLKGCLVVAYTESMAYYTNYRLRKLKLDGIIDILYSSQDHRLHIEKEEIRKYSPEEYKFKHTKHRFTPVDEVKPNPELLKDIIKDIDANLDECVYIGDSLFKDIVMAQHACITDVHAKYGVSHKKKEYELLKKVTHWTDEDVQKERELKVKDVEPSISLNSFDEIKKFFEFIPFQKNINNNINQNIVDIWKQTIDVQKHFNDIALKIRSLAISILGISIGAYGIKVGSEGIDSSIISHISSALSCAWIAFFIMDRLHYHPLLIGAVKQAESIENKYFHILPELALTKSISNESPSTFLGFKIRSAQKLNTFYLIGLIIIAAPWLKELLIEVISKFQ